MDADRTRYGCFSWLALGAALLGLQAALLVVSFQFEYTRPVTEQPVALMTGLLVVAGALYLALFRLIPRTPVRARIRSRTLALVVLVGLGLRALAMPSVAILEDDYYRYLWDGAVVANGHNPYRQSPLEVSLTAQSDRQSPLATLSRSAGPVFERINYPWLATLYPPLAQGAFALSHQIEPFSLRAWRGLLLGCELATLALLIGLLRGLGCSPLWAALYWWNPLVVKELINAAHMDAVLLPLLLAALWLHLRNRHTGAVACLGLATGIKLWPILLLPLVMRPLLDRPARLLAAGVGFVAIAGALLAGMRAGLTGSASGLLAYAGGWEMNDALFLALHWAVQQFGALAGLDAQWSAIASRGLVALALVIICLALSRHRAASAQEACMRWLILIAALFLLSPTQFPWYYTWVVPFLALTPRFSLALMSALLPLYYLRFALDARGQAHWFDHGVVWLEHAPVWVLIAWEWRRGRRAGQNPIQYGNSGQ